MNLPMIFERKGMPMNDLISRKAAIEAVKISDDGCNNPSERHGIIFARVEARRAIQSIPSVPAVPLDKLCECLAERYEPPYALVDIDKLKMPIDFRQQKEIWMNALINWMEEQNA
jgi:hypothetical protein